MITKKFTRREFIKQNSLTSLGTIFGLGIPSLFATECEEESQAAEGEPIIDIHQHTDQTKHSYPEGKVTSGEWTDQLLSRYPNMYGDLSQASGLNVLIWDKDNARGFLERHQDQLLFGRDCADSFPMVGECCSQSVRILGAIRRLSPNKGVERKILYENAKQLFRL